jgi:hypothetical protein
LPAGSGRRTRFRARWYYDADVALEPCARARDNPRLAPWLRERAAFERMQSRLDAHRGRWVAVHRGKVIDVGDDEDALDARVQRRLGEAPFFVGRVGAAPLVVDMPGFVLE